MKVNTPQTQSTSFTSGLTGTTRIIRAHQPVFVNQSPQSPQITQQQQQQANSSASMGNLLFPPPPSYPELDEPKEKTYKLTKNITETTSTPTLPPTITNVNIPDELKASPPITNNVNTINNNDLTNDELESIRSNIVGVCEHVKPKSSEEVKLVLEIILKQLDLLGLLIDPSHNQ